MKPRISEKRIANFFVSPNRPEPETVWWDAISISSEFKTSRRTVISPWILVWQANLNSWVEWILSLILNSFSVGSEQ